MKGGTHLFLLYRSVHSGSSKQTAIPRLPVLEGEITTIEVRKSSQSEHLGISVVGGCETPLVSMIVQEVFSSGAIATDGRIGPGDQILEVNGEDLRELTHHQACRVLRKPCPLLRLTILRERVAEERNTGAEVQDTIRVELTKTSGEQLGIRIAGLQGTTGVCVRDLVEGGLAATDGRLRPRDVILEINGQDMRQATSEQAAELIQYIILMVYHYIIDDILPLSCRGYPCELSINGTTLVGLTHEEAVGVLRASALSQCILLRAMAPARDGDSDEEEEDDFDEEDPTTGKTPSWIMWMRLPEICQVPKSVQLERGQSGSLGFSIVGGCDGIHGKQPILVKSIVPGGSADRDGRLRCGDLILSANGHLMTSISHTMSVTLLKRLQGSVMLAVVSWPGTML
uniref:PDZ domain-containing protein n=1 Tax=Branchiostoma floridae TaxID=7739 RepID=C4A0W5_BRAFL|eukprot:XP_002585559.1 hypothetical protein BRAFLDRAFT_111838 [Branchiostoma floridae]